MHLITGYSNCICIKYNIYIRYMYMYITYNLCIHTLYIHLRNQDCWRNRITSWQITINNPHRFDWYRKPSNSVVGTVYLSKGFLMKLGRCCPWKPSSADGEIPSLKKNQGRLRDDRVTVHQWCDDWKSSAVLLETSYITWLRTSTKFVEISWTRSKQFSE